jgi:hypothetical protein
MAGETLQIRLEASRDGDAVERPIAHIDRRRDPMTTVPVVAGIALTRIADLRIRLIPAR